MVLTEALGEFIALNPPVTLLALAALAASILLLLWGANGPPSIPEMIPFVSNSYLVFKNPQEIARRAKKCFRGGNVVRYRLMNQAVYVVRGQQNMQKLLRGTPDFGSEGFIIQIMDGLFRMTPKDLAKFKNDKSGRLKTPNPGTAASTSVRYWAGVHYLYYDYLTAPHFSDALAAKFDSVFSRQLERQPLGEWATVNIQEFARTQIFASKVVSFCGPRILELTPDFADVYWDFDPYGMMMFYKPPRWLARKAYRAHDRGLAAVQRWLDSAWETFDWNDAEAVESDWEPRFGTRFCREACKWMRDKDFDNESIVGFLMAVIFGLNGNSVSLIIWALMHLLEDPPLLATAREEAVAAYTTDENGARCIDMKKLATMPILQAVFAETLRLHVNLAVAREVYNPIVLEGYEIPKGAYLHGYTGLAHFDDEVWAKDGHPASEFWASRHLVEVVVDKTDEAGAVRKTSEFSLADKAGSYFPFGGGTGMCPGRHFAKQEILLVMAAILSRFEVQLIEWTNLGDGSKSDREPRNDEHYGGMTMPPDRDAKVRWKRLW